MPNFLPLEGKVLFLIKYIYIYVGGQKESQRRLCWLRWFTKPWPWLHMLLEWWLGLSSVLWTPGWILFYIMEFAHHCSIYSFLPVEYPRATQNANKTITPTWHFAKRETIRGPIPFVANIVSKISSFRIKISSVCLKQGSILQHSSWICSVRLS